MTEIYTLKDATLEAQPQKPKSSTIQNILNYSRALEVSDTSTLSKSLWLKN